MKTPKDIEQAADRYIDKLEKDYYGVYVSNEEHIRLAFRDGARWMSNMQIVESLNSHDELDRMLLEHELASLTCKVKKLDAVNKCLKGELNRRWTSRTEQEIPMKELVLVRYKDGGMSLASRYKADDGNIYFVTSSGEREIIEDVTHWMSIPPLPRKEE